MAGGYLFGNKFESDKGQNRQYFQVARVKSIVLGPFKGGTEEIDLDYKSAADIGKIRYEILYSPLGTSFSKEVSEPAWPMWGFVKQYPVINEIVFIVVGPTPNLNDNYSNQRRFYLPAYGTWGDSNHNAFPNMNEYGEYLKKFTNKSGYSGNATTGSSIPLGYTFEENPEIKSIRAFEGDSILQARFGQSIRFGSTVSDQRKENNWSNSGNNGDPITIILNQQGPRPGMVGVRKFDPIIEDINLDGSAIYMTSTQEIFMEDLNNFPLRSFGQGISPINQPVIEVRRPILIAGENESATQSDNEALS